MKLNSVEKRTKDHKRIKDITDIFALIWYSESDLDEMKNKIKNLKPSKEIEKIISNFKEHEIIQASDIINYNPEDMRRILNAFAKSEK